MTSAQFRGTMGVLSLALAMSSVLTWEACLMSSCWYLAACSADLVRATYAIGPRPGLSPGGRGCGVKSKDAIALIHSWCSDMWRDGNRCRNGGMISVIIFVSRPALDVAARRSRHALPVCWWKNSVWWSVSPANPSSG